MRQSLLVTPSYHDVARLSVFGPELARELAYADLDLRWVIADDGSGPAEVERLRLLADELREIYPKVEVFSPGKHLGKGGVIHRVWDNDREDEWLCFLDADGSVDGETYVGLLQKALSLGRGHAVIASRRDSPETRVRQSAFRKFSHKVMGWLIRQALKLPVYDSQCGAKCIHGDDYRAVIGLLREKGLMFDSELLLALFDSGVKLVEVPVNWVERPGGTVSPFRDAIPMLWSLRKVRKRLRSGAL